jgi:hypothetical protein
MRRHSSFCLLVASTVVAAISIAACDAGDYTYVRPPATGDGLAVPGAADPEIDTSRIGALVRIGDRG